VSFQWPLGDSGVNFHHEADGFAQGRYDFAVAFQIVIGQGSAKVLFEPLFANLTAADVEIPDFGRNAFEVLPLGSALQTMLAHVHAARRKRLAWAMFRQSVPWPHPCQTAARTQYSRREKYSVPL